VLSLVREKEEYLRTGILSRILTTKQEEGTEGESH
jgi:hypothetical protein